MSRVLPILFNTDMVRAILDGRKTVTRRGMKPQPTGKVSHLTGYKTDEWGEMRETATGEKYFSRFKLPYQPGDILYVRKTWSYEQDNVCIGLGNGGECPYESCEKADGPCFRNHYIYKASDNLPVGERWHPSIHMPKEAARIWLKVTDVRVERLQEISEYQIVAEGTPYDKENYEQWKRGDVITFNAKTYLRKCYRDFWNSTIKQSDLDRYGWDANPWVWAIEFERCEKEEGDAKC